MIYVHIKVFKMPAFEASSKLVYRTSDYHLVSSPVHTGGFSQETSAVTF
jgi:hypothetical protein